MKFGKIAVNDAEGSLLAHSLQNGRLSFRKGRSLSRTDIEALKAAGIETVVAARLEAGDISEDEAANRIGRLLAGANVTANAAFTGRVNLTAAATGLITYDRFAIEQVNLTDEAVTIATAPPFDLVVPNQIIATIKIIPYGLSETMLSDCLQIAEQAKAKISIASFTEKKVGLAQTTLSGGKESILKKTSDVMISRVNGLSSCVLFDERIPHTQHDVAKMVRAASTRCVDILLIAGASAITDRRDVIPAGIVDAGGTVIHCGMPVDPGNLLLLGKFDDMDVIGLPGCARSPKFNGIDLVLRRLAADLPVTSGDIMAMGVGGLLKEIPNRPSPRSSDINTLPSRPRIAGLVLAAGQSRRMGSINKLLADIDGQPMVSHSTRIVTESEASPVVAVTGHQADNVAKALEPYDLTIVHNPYYAEGISGSLQRGLSALPKDVDGVIICLGDMPKVASTVINKLIAAFNPVEQRAICIPTWHGKRGNPVLLASRFFDEIHEISGDVGARGLLGAYPELIYEVEIESDAILTDIDTPQALENVRSCW